MVKNYFSISFLIVVLFLGCQKDELQNRETDQKNYDLSGFEKFLPPNSQVILNSSEIVDIQDETFTEYLIQHDLAYPENSKIHFTVLIDDHERLTIAKIIDVKLDNDSYRLSKRQNTAIVRMVNEAGQANSFHYTAGTFTDLLSKKGLGEENSKRFALDRGYIYIETERFKDWYKVTGSGLEYTHTSYEGLTREVIFSNTSGYNDYFSYPTFQAGGGTYDSSVGANYDGSVSFQERTLEKIAERTEETEDILIDSSFSRYPCARQIVEKSYEGCTPLTELLLTIFEANNNIDLTFKVDENMVGNGKTDPQFYFNPSTRKMNVNVSFRGSYLSTATDLSIARSTIHESMHAIFVYMFEEGKLSTITGQADPDFPELFDAFIEYNRTSSTANLNKTQHELMNDFINEMATSLSAYGNAAGYNLPLSYYKKLCYSGDMLASASFKNSYPEYVNPADRTNNIWNRNPDFIEILYSVLSEQDNSTQTYTYPDGTSFTATPKGKPVSSVFPCN